MTMNVIISWINTSNHIHCPMQFKFIVEEDAALPVDPAFWDYLMASSQTQWSLIVYEQDWLNVQFSKTKALHVSQPVDHLLDSVYVNFVDNS